MAMGSVPGLSFRSLAPAPPPFPAPALAAAPPRAPAVPKPAPRANPASPRELLVAGAMSVMERLGLFSGPVGDGSEMVGLRPSLPLREREKRPVVRRWGNWRWPGDLRPLAGTSAGVDIEGRERG